MHQDVALHGQLSSFGHFALADLAHSVFAGESSHPGFAQLDVDGQHYLVLRASNQKLRLSSREQQAVDFVSSGHTQKEAAFEMGIADSTLRVLLHRAMKKLACAAAGPTTFAQPLAQSSATS